MSLSELHSCACNIAAFITIIVSIQVGPINTISKRTSHNVIYLIQIVYGDIVFSGALSATMGVDEHDAEGMLVQCVATFTSSTIGFSSYTHTFLYYNPRKALESLGKSSYSLPDGLDIVFSVPLNG